jgi:hypothetical protein
LLFRAEYILSDTHVYFCHQKSVRIAPLSLFCVSENGSSEKLGDLSQVTKIGNGKIPVGSSST